MHVPSSTNDPTMRTVGHGAWGPWPRWVGPAVVALVLATLTACGPSGAASGPDDGSTPPEPTDVTVEHRVGAALVTWTDASDGEASFRVYRETVASRDLQRQALEPIADVAAGTTRYVDEDVTPGQVYRYAVAAVTPSGSSGTVPQEHDPAAIPASQASFSVGTQAYRGADGLEMLRTQVAIAWATVVDGEITTQIVAPDGEVVWSDVTTDPELRAWTLSRAEPTSGVYELVARFGDGSEVTAEVEVDATDVLPAPSNIEISEATAERVTASWDAYDPGVVLWATLDEAEGGESVGTVDAGSTGVAFEADELDAPLEPGGSYQLVITGSDGPTPRAWDPPRQENGLNVRGPTFRVADPSGPDPDPDTIAAYEVPAGQVALVTSVTGTIDGYAPPAADVSTTLVGLAAGIACTGVGDTQECTYTPDRPWIPAPIDDDGSFAVELPASPVLSDSAWTLNVCGAPLDVAMNGLIVAHDGALGDVGVEPMAQYGRRWIEEGSERVEGGTLYDPSVWVAYGYSASEKVTSCVETMESPDPDQGEATVDADLDIRPGWNVITWVTRSEAGELTLYLRTGEPNASVPWVEIEEATP